MPENQLFAKLCKPQVLQIGWHLAHADSRDDFISDPAGYADFGASLTARLGFMVREISNDRYRPRAVTNIDVPKSGLSVRPGNVLPIEESALLHAIMYLVAPRIDRRISSNVYSYRLHKDWQKRVRKGESMFREGEAEIPFLRGATLRKIDPMESWYRAWPEFDRQRIRLAREQGYTHLTRTDIAAYFENIDLGVLDSLLRRWLPAEPRLVSLIHRILHSWTRVTSTGTPIGRGIPQGNDISSFLGNLYLTPLDSALTQFCKRHKAEWIRYVDDVEIYAQDDATAREVVLVINDALRRLYLNLQGSKTEIVTGEKLEEQLASADMEAVDKASKMVGRTNISTLAGKAVVRRVMKNMRPLARRFTRNLPESARDLSKKNGRILMRLFTIYGRIGSPRMRRVARAVLTEPPELRRLLKSLRYYEQLPVRYHDEVVGEVLGVLEDQALPLFPYHVAACLHMLTRLHPTQAQLNIALRTTRIGARHTEWPVRQKALELLAVIPSRRETAEARGKNALAHHHPFVRRAGLVMLTRAESSVLREGVESTLGDPDSSVARLSVYWHRLMRHEAFALQTLKDRTRDKATDQSFLWRLNMFWVLSASENRAIVGRLRQAVESHTDSRSARVQWHIRQLYLATKWVSVVSTR